MPTPLITIAMPFFNGAATLDLAIRSLLNQSFTGFELLLCDDGSTDASLAIANSFRDPRIICWSDGRRRRLAARLNECIDRARGKFLARMDADDIAYPRRLATQLEFLESEPAVDLCGARAMVFGKRGRALWRFSPVGDHSGITQSPFRGFPMWHPTWMGRIAWFRQWRYQETALLAQDQELLLRSYKQSYFANLPEILLGYRQEQVSLRKLLRYKVLYMKSVRTLAPQGLSSWQKTQLIAVSGARFAANCVAALGEPEQRLGHQSAEEPSAMELGEWRALWTLLSCWYGKPISETFIPSPLASPAKAFPARDW